MATFIANMIIKQANISVEKGQAKYRAYFVNTSLYTKYKADVETILVTNGYTECIVIE